MTTHCLITPAARWLNAVALLLCALSTLPIAHGDEDCEPRFSPGPWVRHSPLKPDRIHVLKTFDDGSGGGPAIFAGGGFSDIGTLVAQNIAKLVGDRWYTLAGGVEGDVWAIEVFDDGNGPALYVAGDFTTADGTVVNNIAKWDGTSWSPLDDGVDDYVRALAIYNDGTGDALYVGGNFRNAGSVPVNRIARWDGDSWSPLGSGVNRLVRTLEIHDDGNGEALYAGGRFTTAGGDAANHVAKWDGSSWEALGDGVNDDVWDLESHDDGNGPALYAAGDFTMAGSSPTPTKIAVWEGTTWAWAGEMYCCPPAERIYALESIDDDAEPALYAGGYDGFQGRLYVLSNDGWDSLSSGYVNSMYSLVSAENPQDIGVYQTIFSGLQTLHIAGYRHPAFANDQRVMQNFSPSVADAAEVIRDAIVFDSGNGAELVVAGSIFSLDINDIARWDGTQWHDIPLSWPGDFGDRSDDSSYTLAVYDDGTGEGLFIAGEISSVNGTPANNIVKWDGVQWHPLAGGTNDTIYDSVVFDDGNGPALYVAGSFTAAGGQPANRVAKWDGDSWSSLGAGLDGIGFTLVVHSDGNDTSLYAGGDFTTAGGQPADNIAKWDGAAWSAVGVGLGATVRDLESFDDGTSNLLIAGGDFLIVEGDSADRIAAWNTQQWTNIGDPSWGFTTGFGREALALECFGEGSEKALFAALYNIGTSARGVLKWQGGVSNQWQKVAVGSIFHLKSLQYNTIDGPALHAFGPIFTLDTDQEYVGVNIAILPSDCPDVVPPPPSPGPFNIVSPANGAIDVDHATSNLLTWMHSTGATAYTITLSENPDLSNPVVGPVATSSTDLFLSADTLMPETAYHWSVLARNGVSDTTSGSPAIATFITRDLTTPCPGDINGDNVVDLADFNVLGINFGAGPSATREQGDLNEDGYVNLADFNILGINFGNSCP